MLVRMRRSEFWTRMELAFGTTYADSLARDLVIGKLGGRTVHEALSAGEPAKEIWRIVCEELPVPAAIR